MSFAPPREGVVAVVKRDCPTCVLVAPVLADLAGRGVVGAVVSQDDAAFPPGVEVVDDRDLDVSLALEIRTVPTLVRFEHGHEVDRFEGWERAAWEKFTGTDGLGPGLPEFRPG